MHEFETLINPFDNDFIETNMLEIDMTTIEDYNLMNDTDETYVYDLEGESADQRTRPSYQQKETLLFKKWQTGKYLLFLILKTK